MRNHHTTVDPSKPIIVSTPASRGGGPRTHEGRVISSRNATRHGCCSQAALILPNENILDYRALEATWFSAYKPHEEAEKRLVQQLVDADWFLERATRTLAQVEADIFNSAASPMNWTDDQHRKLTRFTRYQTARAGAVAKCRKAIEDYRKNRSAEKIKTERHEIYKEKNKPEPTVEELIRQMHQRKKEHDLAEQSRPA